MAKTQRQSAYKGTATVGHRTAVPHTPSTDYYTVRHSTSGYILERTENGVLKTYLYISVLYKSETMQATQVSINGWRDEQRDKDVVDTRGGTLSSLRKE